MRPRWGRCAAWGSGFPVGAPGPGLLGEARPVASVPAPGARVTQGQGRQYRRGATWSRAPRPLWGNFPAGQARPWVSSYASGGAAPVDKCTERRWDTNDCRQLHPVGEAPSRRAHRGMRQNHIPEWWVEAVVRGRGVLGWDGSLACPSAEGSSVYMGRVVGGGAARVPACGPSCNGSGSLAIGIIGRSPGAGPSEGGPACGGAPELDCAATRG